MEPKIIATTNTDKPGLCIVTWEGFGDQGVQCYGWIEGDYLFVPADGSTLTTNHLIDDKIPDHNAKWYECSTGKDALFNIPGATLAIII
jgi:hypothetical protein